MGVGNDNSVNHPVVELGTVRLRARNLVCANPGSERVAENPASAPLVSRNDSIRAIVFGNGLVAVISVQVIEPSAAAITVQDAPT
jgi:hypothetical protein